MTKSAKKGTKASRSKTTRAVKSSAAGTKKATAKKKAAATKKATAQGKTAAKTAKKTVKKTARRRPIPDIEVDPEVLEFIAAIDRFKKDHGRPFPSWSEILHIVHQLGYRKSAEAMFRTAVRRQLTASRRRSAAGSRRPRGCGSRRTAGRCGAAGTVRTAPPPPAR